MLRKIGEMCEVVHTQKKNRRISVLAPGLGRAISEVGVFNTIYPTEPFRQVLGTPATAQSLALPSTELSNRYRLSKPTIA